MEDRRVADYFVVAGLPDNPQPLEEFCSESANLKPTHNQAPITDIAVILQSAEEFPPEGYTLIETTVSGFSANLNHGSIRSPSVFLCYRRGRDKAPLVDIGVLYEGKERLMIDSEVILKTPYSRSANVNNSGTHTYITYRRASETAPCNELVVTDICVILSNKGEVPPHTFCMIPKNLNKGMVGSDVFLCYKKSMNTANSIAFKPAVLGQFPLVEHDDFPSPQSVPLFCLPMGATVESWPEKAKTPKPVFSTFVLTVSHTVEKVYGAAVTFYEDYLEEKLSSDQRDQLKLDLPNKNSIKQLKTNKCICILSHWPFFETFEKFLLYLHEIFFSGPHSIPIERYISHFMLEIPFPSPQRPRILIQLNNTSISLAQPEDSPLPLSGASFRQLLRNLGPDNSLMLVLFALTEQKILIHSLRPDVLTSVAEAVAMLIFPFHWQCPYIPLCPLGLSDVLNAPMPFIVGVDSRYFDLYDPPHDVTCVDLDTNTISIADEKKSLHVKLLPKKPTRVLRNTLQILYEKLHQLEHEYTVSVSKQVQTDEFSLNDKDAKLKKQEKVVELEIQEAFLRFTASILKGFRSFLQPITKAPTVTATDCSSLFDMQGFLKSRDKAYQRFYTILMKTQMFTRFIEERSFVSDKDASLAFFDDCTEKVDTGDYPESKLLDLDESHQSERTVFITPPEPIGLPPDATYTYNGFKCLNNSLYYEKHHVKSWVTALAKSSPAPGSPLAKRTKQEIRSAQKIAKKHSEKPVLWSKCLLSYCYTLWFIHLPAYVKMCQSKAKALRTAYDVLVKMQAARLQPPDEVCYRVLMQLCGQYGQPVLAVKLLSEMKRNGVQPNAITYGYYNKAVLESTWPSGTSSGHLMWAKLRNVVRGVALFKRGLSHGNCSESDFDGISHGSTDGSTPDMIVPDAASHSAEHHHNKTDDGGSTGGQSDMGYGSTNADETQKSSSSISTSSQVTTTDGDIGCTLEAPMSRESLANSNVERKNSGTTEKLSNRILKFEDVDFSESDEFRSRVGSIVKTSVGLLGNMNSLRRDTDVDSSAGILITGQASLLEEIQDSNNSFRSKSWRKRHRSASEYGPRCTSSRYRLRHQSGPEHELNCQLNNHDSLPNHRMLRSDSFGNDAKILSHLSIPNDHEEIEVSTAIDSQELNNKNNAAISEESGSQPPEDESSDPLAKPQLTPVTQNDPLGLFSGPTPPITSSPMPKTTQTTPNKESWFDLEALRNSLKSYSGVALTRTESKVTRSATFCHSPQHSRCINGKDPTSDDKKTIVSSSTILSETPPTQPPRSTSTSGLSSTPLGALGFKLPFSPSPRKTDFFIGLRSAANTMVNKLSEIKEAISSSSKSPAVRSLSENRISFEEDLHTCESTQRSSVDYLSRSTISEDIPFDEIDQLVGEVKQARPSGGFSFERGLPPLPDLMNLGAGDKLYIDNSAPASVGLEIIMTSCSKCYTCSSLLYDEEIMIGWTAEDSNLNTRCQFCENKLVPFLYVTIRDYRLSEQEKLTAAHSSDSMHSAHSFPLLPIRKNSLQLDPPDVNSVLGQSLESDNFVLLEESPDSISTSSGIGSPLGSPNNNNNNKSYFPRLLENHSEAPIVCTKKKPDPHRTDATHPSKECLSTVDENAELDANSLDSEKMHNESTSLASSRTSSSVDVRPKDQRADLSAYITLEPISVPYLSPIVLRKELENVLEHEGDSCLSEPQFVDDHPIIFWNLMWFFKRIEVPSHLPSLCLHAQSVNKDREIPPVWVMADSSNIQLKCMWDNPKLHEDIGPPMYILWSQNGFRSSLVHALVTEEKSVTKEMMQKIISSVQCNDLLEPIKLMLGHVKKKRPSARRQHHSVYRDLLFLAIMVFGRDDINQTSFEREYRRAYDKLPQSVYDVLRKCDRPPSLGTFLCRQAFQDLEL